MQERIAVPGVCIGLAWTAFGGEILFIEAIQTPGTGALKLTGQMGEVMLESASLAFSYVKKLLKEKNAWDEKSAKRMDLHVHIPAGAIPKDGPSAGIALATAMMSLYLGKKIRNKLAMTGELSLVGKVLAVGGIKEKLLAAHRAGIKTVLLPEANKKDLIDVPDFVQNKLDIQFVKHLSDVFSSVLTDFI
jgi:ATP-dependent Lon protease